MTLGGEKMLFAYADGTLVTPDKVLTDTDMTVIEQRVLPEDLVAPVAGMMGAHGLDVWVYRGADWYVPALGGPHVARESWTASPPPSTATSCATSSDTRSHRYRDTVKM